MFTIYSRTSYTFYFLQFPRKRGMIKENSHERGRAMLLADLHIHSRYSRATSRDCTPEALDLWARRKGIAMESAVPH